MGMRKEEQKVWDSMRAARPEGFWLSRVENIAAEGMGDVYCVYKNGTNRWVELKAATVPVRATTPLLGKAKGMRTSQEGWHRRMSDNKVATFVLIRTDKKELFLIPGRFAEEINGWPIEKFRVESVADSWREVYETLGAK